MDTSKAVEIGALRRLLEECRSKAADLQIADVAYILLMAETSIVEHLGQLKEDQNHDGSAELPRATEGVASLNRR